MIVSVTANTTVDLTLFVGEFEWNKTIRANDYIYSMGGKPTDASFILGTLGTPSLALGFAAGTTGQKVESMLRARGVTPDFIQVEGETRTCVNVIVTDGRGQTTITTNMMKVREAHVEQLRTRYLKALDDATVVVLGGTLPQGMTADFYPEFIKLARDRKIPVVFDAAEPNLSAGLKSQPDYIKPNDVELGGLVGRPINSVDEAYQAGQEILNQYQTASVISLGKHGGMVVLPGRTYYVPPLDIEVVSATGAGDGVLAGITWAIHKGLPVEEGLRLGFAAASAICMMPGTAECRPEDVEKLLPQVELIAYPEG